MEHTRTLSSADLAALPIATDHMPVAQRRQLSMDFMALQTSFRWIPDMDVLDYPTTYVQLDKSLLHTDLYIGIPYQSTGSGTPYRWLEYYDQSTGVMALRKAFAENGGYGEGAALYGAAPTTPEEEKRKKFQCFRALFNACSQSTGWSWARVVNTATFRACARMNLANGFIPVGCFSYGYDHEGKHYGPLDIDIWGKVTPGNPLAYKCSDVIRDMGKDALYACYAQIKPGDCLVSPRHVVMAKEVHVLTDENGCISDDSTAFALEQIEGWGAQGTLEGKNFHRQGSTSSRFTFAKLMELGYLPFTFAEFLDENDLQDKKHLDYYDAYKDQLTHMQQRYTLLDAPADTGTAAVEKGRVFANMASGDITAQQFQGLVVGSNYMVSDVFVSVTDAAGETLLKNVRRCPMNTYEVAMTEAEAAYKTDTSGNDLPMYAGLAQLAGQGHTVTVTMRISTGELLTVLTGKLMK